MFEGEFLWNSWVENDGLALDTPIDFAFSPHLSNSGVEKIVCFDLGLLLI